MILILIIIKTRNQTVTANKNLNYINSKLKLTPKIYIKKTKNILFTSLL